MNIRFHASLGVLALVALLPLVASAYDGSAAPISRTEGGSRVMAVSAGHYHSCGLKADGSVVCWGSNGNGQVDPAVGTSLTDPGTHPGPYLSVAAGGSHTCGLKADGSVSCWGLDTFGQSTAPNGAFKSVSAGQYHSCGLKVDGSITCWGDAYYGQATAPAGVFLSVSAGMFHTCGLRTNGSVECWGWDENGQVDPSDGNQTSDTGIHTGPYQSVSAGWFHTCGLKADGSVDCWGDDYHGQGTPSTGAFLSVSAGETHTCGLKVDGSVDCWGYDYYGQYPTPTGAFLSASVGRYHTCGLKADGSVRCWGANANGQTTVPASLAAAGSTAFGQIAAGNAHACDLKRDGSIRCWGDNTNGQAAPPLGEFTQVVAGDVLTCAIGAGGKVACWGRDGATITGLADVMAGMWRQLAPAPDGAVCMLSSLTSEVRCQRPGFGSMSSASDFRNITHGPNFESFPTACGVGASGGAGSCVFGGFAAIPAGPWQRLESGLSHQCGLKADGTLSCWGDNSEGQTDNVPTGTFRALSVGYNHACTIRGDGTLACWGSNVSGQTDPPAGTYVQVAAGNTFSCAIRSDGQRACWGGAPGNPATLSALPNGVSGTAYSRQISISGPSAPTNPVFVPMSGALPPGLSISASGLVSGTPTTVGTFTFTIDAEGTGDFAATRTYSVTISDGTPPAIDYAFDPPAPDGSNGWYVGDVDVDWTVTDPESAISSSTGCNDTTLSSDTAGASWTCSAASTGGSNSVTTAIVKRDATPPTITTAATTAPDGNNGWYVSPVTVSFTCNDALSGIASCPADQVLNSDGNPVSSTAQTATDNAGNASAPSNVVAVKIDRTPPTLAPSVPSPILVGQSASASPNASDATSGIASSSCGPLDTSSRGDFSTICSATDNAGNSRTVQMDYTVSTTCANDGYKGTQLTWCRNICENGLTGATLDTWIHRWIQRYRDLPYCLVVPAN